MKRCFISIDIPENIKKEIISIQKSIPKFYGKLIEAENLHLTLKFLGEIDEEKIELVKERLNEIKFDNFEVAVDSLGVFSEKFIRIIWLHLSNCEELQRAIDEELGDLFPKEKRFMSHLTIARVKKVGDREFFLEELKKIEIPQMKFNVDSFNLKESILYPEGPIYLTIEKYKLKS